MNFLTDYIDQYGYLFLFAALMLELLAFPLPGEVVMGYAGFLAFQGKLSWILCIIFGTMGASIGMTIAYWIGFKLGMPFFRKHGHKFHMGPERLDNVSTWFNKYGNKILIVSYFIPGVRHFTGYFSGITRIPFRLYAVYAYSGAFIWVVTFISLGKILGPKWEQFHESIKKYLIIASIAIVFLLICIYLYRKNQTTLKSAIVNVTNKSLKVFHTRKRAGVFIVALTLVTLSFIILMVGMIQDFLAGEFQDFNTVVNVIVTSLFTNNWDFTMNALLYLGSNKILIFIILLSIFWIIFKGEAKGYQVIFYLIIVGGGEIYEEGLRNIFHRLLPVDISIIARFSFNFPSEQSLMAFVIYGYFTFIYVRYSKRIWIHSIGFSLFAFLLLLLAISRIYYGIQAPSQIAAGYVFGGVWLGVNLLLYEINRLMKSIS